MILYSVIGFESLLVRYVVMTDLLGYDVGYKERDDVYYTLGGSCVWEGCVRHVEWYIMEVAVPATDGELVQRC